MPRRLNNLSVALTERGHAYSRHVVSANADRIRIAVGAHGIEVTMTKGLIDITDDEGRSLPVDQQQPIITIMDWIDEAR